MCASGLTNARTLPNDMIRAAMEMQAFLEKEKQRKMKLGQPYFEARIGIHTGTVVAGVVGLKKFVYDIWGDAVNIAARMEQNCEVGKVNISETTYQQVRYKFYCEYRGKVKAKNKGLIDMYYVKQPVAVKN
jgi:class 3 adenylate cyclase